MTFKEIEEYILSFPGSFLDFPFGGQAAVYKIPIGKDDKMFALMDTKKDPINISLKCDPNLAEALREQYDEVQPGYHLNKKHWNTIVLTGQLDKQQIFDLIRHSHDLVSDS